MAETKPLLDEFDIIREGQRNLPDDHHRLKLLAALAELEDNSCHKHLDVQTGQKCVRKSNGTATRYSPLPERVCCLGGRFSKVNAKDLMMRSFTIAAMGGVTLLLTVMSASQSANTVKEVKADEYSMSVYSIVERMDSRDAVMWLNFKNETDKKKFIQFSTYTAQGVNGRVFYASKEFKHETGGAFAVVRTVWKRKDGSVVSSGEYELTGGISFEPNETMGVLVPLRVPKEAGSLTLLVTFDNNSVNLASGTGSGVGSGPHAFFGRKEAKIEVKLPNEVYEER
jgi:hypothetical protein